MSKHESKPGELMTSSEGASPKINFVKEILAGLTVSFVAISLGAAFGVISGRGALSGILSAGVIALITAILGGTRIQCSGPTAPMTAVTVVMIGLIGNGYLNDVPNANSDHFLNIVLILTGAMLVLAAVLRLGKFINLVPKVVISGFMNGIAVLIWVGEVKTLFGLNSEKDSSGVELVDAAGNPLPDILAGGIGINLAVAIGTVAMCFLLPSLLKRIDKRLASFLPGTLVAIVLVSAGVFLTGLDMEKVALGGSLSSVTDLTTLVQEQIPTGWSVQLILLALPFAAQLAMLAYLDTLLTSLVVDQKVQKMYGTDEKTAQNKELAAQGVANSAVALFGGIPGAQATIRSVLILNEGAMTRIAGVMVELFVLVEMILFQDLITAIPKAVFSGVLIKVGYDVFDWTPVRIYFKELRQGFVPNATQKTGKPMITHLNIVFILGTTLVTVLWNLNVAVIVFCILFYLLKVFVPIHDLEEATETEGLIDEV